MATSDISVEYGSTVRGPNPGSDKLSKVVASGGAPVSAAQPEICRPQQLPQELFTKIV